MKACSNSEEEPNRTVSQNAHAASLSLPLLLPHTCNLQHIRCSDSPYQGSSSLISPRGFNFRLCLERMPGYEIERASSCFDICTTTCLIKAQKASGLQAGAPQEGKGAAVRASTIDNFQGEEARIVIVSLVRSTAHGKIGFLNEAQRVNVLLSRARDGLILVGNPKCLLGQQGTLTNTGETLAFHMGKQEVKVQEQVLVYPEAGQGGFLRNLGRQGSTWKVVLQNIPVVPGFPARCHRHGHERLVSSPGGFEAHVPDGGCLLKCDADLGCGHKCPLRCHSTRQPHAKCMEVIPCKCATYSLLHGLTCFRFVCTCCVRLYW